MYKYLITYVGVKMKSNISNPTEPGFITVVKDCSVDCLDDIAAEEYATNNVDTFLSLDGGFTERTWVVRDYVSLSSADLQRHKADDVVRNNLTKHLDPIVDEFLSGFWSSNKQRQFMLSCLQSKLSTARDEKQRAAHQAKYMTQVCKQQNEVALRFFHRKVTEEYLENQIYNRIFQFLCPELSMADTAEEGVPTSTKL